MTSLPLFTQGPKNGVFDPLETHRKRWDEDHDISLGEPTQQKIVKMMTEATAPSERQDMAAAFLVLQK